MIGSVIEEIGVWGDVRWAFFIIAEMALAMGMKLRQPRITACPLFGDLCQSKVGPGFFSTRRRMGESDGFWRYITR